MKNNNIINPASYGERIRRTLRLLLGLLLIVLGVGIGFLAGGGDEDIAVKIAAASSIDPQLPPDSGAVKFQDSATIIPLISPTEAKVPVYYWREVFERYEMAAPPCYRPLHTAAQEFRFETECVPTWNLIGEPVEERIDLIKIGALKIKPSSINQFLGGLQTIETKVSAAEGATEYPRIGDVRRTVSGIEYRPGEKLFVTGRLEKSTLVDGDPFVISFYDEKRTAELLEKNTMGRAIMFRLFAFLLLTAGLSLVLGRWRRLFVTASVERFPLGFYNETPLFVTIIASAILVEAFAAGGAAMLISSAAVCGFFALIFWQAARKTDNENSAEPAGGSAST